MVDFSFIVSLYVSDLPNVTRCTGTISTVSSPGKPKQGSDYPTVRVRVRRRSLSLQYGTVPYRTLYLACTDVQVRYGA